MLRKLAHGGMAEVFLARLAEAPESSQPLVVKCILPELATEPQFLAMFVNEAQLAAQMRHPGVVQVVDFGEASGRLFMAMEYVEGLDCWRFSHRLTPWGDDHAAVAVYIVMQVLAALEHVHALTDVNGVPLGVVHRDLSPSNIYLSVNGEVKIGDFGIARIDSNRYRKVTMIPKGKYGYVAPEQVVGLSIDGRADIFSMGVVLAELLIGKRMFTGSSQLSVLMDIRDGRLPTLERNQHLVESEMLSILHRALARVPGDRFDSAAAFRESLGSYTQRTLRIVSRTDLASLVRRALTLADPTLSIPLGNNLAPTPVSQEATGPGSAGLTLRHKAKLTPVTVVEVSKPPANEYQETLAGPDETDPLASEEGTPITALDDVDSANWIYTVEMPDGSRIGPASYASVIENVITGMIQPDTLVSGPQGPFRPASAFPELVRHMPTRTPTTTIGELKQPSRAGDFAYEPPAAVMLNLSESRFTGALMAKRGPRRKEVYWFGGHPVYVSSNDPSELLGEYLLARGAIDRAELDTALALMPKFNGHLGDTLIALGLIPAVELLRHIGEQIVERFAECIRWCQGSFEVYEGIACRPDVIQVELDPYDNIASALLEPSRKDGRAVPGLASSPALVRLTTNGAARIEALGLPRELAIILRGLREPKRLSDIIAAQSDLFGEDALEQALFVAFEAGIWQLEDVPIPWREPISQPRE